MVSFNFLYPQFLWFLLLVPFFVFVYFFGLVYNKKKGIVFGNFKALERFYGIEFFSKNFVALYLNAFILVILILSLSGVGVNFNADTSSYSFVLLVDSSSSMLADDITPNRLIAAKGAASDFVARLPIGVDVGVVGFGGASVVYQTLDSNKLLVKMGIDNIELAEVEGTNIYDALVSADKMFDFVGDSEKMKAVILFSDGQINVGDAPLIIEFAKRNNIVIYTVGVGTEHGGETLYETISKADIDFLKSLSFNTEGEFFRINDGNFDKLLDSFVEMDKYKVEVDVSIYLLMGAVLLFSLNWILYNFRFRTFP